MGAEQSGVALGQYLAFLSKASDTAWQFHPFAHL
jgi:hypothetical protein